MKSPRTKSLKKRSYKKRSPLRKPTVSKAVKQYVKKSIHVAAENKIVNFNQAQNFGNILNNASMYAYPVLPYTGFGTIPQGITQGSRIANSVTIRKVMLKYVLTSRGYNVDSNPFPAPTVVQMFLGRLKGCPGELPAAADFNNLFQLGSSVLAVQGNITDVVSDINKDYWDIQKGWTHKVGYAGYNGTGSIAASQYFNNNDYKLNVIKRLDITKYVQKVLKFNDSNNTVQGKNLFFFFQALNAQGGTNGSTVLPCTINYWIDIQYEDN